MSRIRVCFLGTPEFAIPSLNQLLEDEHFEVVGVISQPDRPAGRNLKLTPSPIKLLAQSQGLRVLTPVSVNTPETLSQIQSWGAEVAIVVAFGQILSQGFLDFFPLGALNVHGSILPFWRGAAPIQRSIEAGDLETGVTLQKIVKKLDAGDTLGFRKIPIGENQNSLEIHYQLAVLGAELIHVEAMDYIRGHLGPIPQDHTKATHAAKILKTESLIDWALLAQKIHNKVRAFVWGPGTFAWIQWGDEIKKIKIHQTVLAKTSAAKIQLAAGEILWINQRFLVGTGDQPLELLVVQLESKQKVKASEFVKGISADELKKIKFVSKEGNQ